jgi:hypothetical protein
MERNTYQRWAITPFDMLEGAISRWLTGTKLSPHDHGGSRGFVFLFWGELHERKFREDDGVLTLESEVVARAPSFTFIKEEDIHEVSASRPSMALHLYYPKPGFCRTFES